MKPEQMAVSDSPDRRTYWIRDTTVKFVQVLKLNSFEILFFTIWLTINAGDGVWVYYYVKTTVDPNPRTVVNKTNGKFTAFEVMMYLFGFPWSIVNGWVIYWLTKVAASSEFATRPDGRYRRLAWWFIPILIFIVTPIAAVFVLLPAFGGWIVVPIVQNWAWNHRCDEYPMFAVLDSRRVQDPSYTPNVARFYQTETNKPLFSYYLNGGEEDSDNWRFTLREFHTDQSLIPITLYPTLQSVHYGFLNSTILGNCTVPVSSGSSDVTTTSCMTGTFDAGAWLSFNLTSAVPFNNTFPSTPVPSTTTLLRALDKEWIFGYNQIPSVILRTVNTLTNELTTRTVLKTSVEKRGDCTAMKVCLAGTPRLGSVVGAEVMGPLGLLLIRQADHARICTLPSNNY
ncbi:hypothetical protein BXZ70DRAFT_1005586 [Cristinia sonorae]|uniref:Transmembrane protein n=1 Tax=Cristinia sonorae TaxID=1940300 RepID=A0A8K0UTV8_9AGAR|nr:hypothetical protein BXZ70DRAFT_1005586 [Cristinia sonorae]